jgi:UDP-N-acetylglucosamine acyltransferase
MGKATVKEDSAMGAAVQVEAAPANGAAPATAAAARGVPAGPAASENGKAAGKTRPWFKYLRKFRLFSGEHPKISPQAVVDEKAQIADDVEIGPFCVVGPDVKIASGCRLLNNVTILGKTTIGKDNIFFPNAVIGAPPQDLKYRGAETLLEIGDSNTFREAVTVHTGTEKGGGITRIGNFNLLMINVHLAHDVQLGSRCILANNCMIAGHVIVGDHVTMMGLVGIHHYVTIGRFAYLGGAARIHHDVPPFVKVDEEDNIRAVNKTGLRRAGGFTDEDCQALHEAVRKLWYAKPRNFSKALASFDLENGINPYVKELVEFLQRRDQGKHGRWLEGQRAS